MVAKAMTARFGLGADSRVVELASNDGYLLQYFKARGINVLGIEPSANVAEVAAAKRGIPSVVKFFGRQTARELAAEGVAADLMCANNVLAHVPDINDFVGGFAVLLKAQGVATFEFPHLLRMVQECQFDTAYHEHYSYLSLTAVQRIFAANGLQVFDVEELPTHGGSLRVYAQRSDAGQRAVMPAVAALLARALRPRLPLVVDSDDWEGWGGWNDLLPYPASAKRLFAWQERDLPRRADAVTVASRTLQTQVWGSGVPPEEVFYLPNGIEGGGGREAQGERVSSDHSPRASRPSPLDRSSVAVSIFAGWYARVSASTAVMLWGDATVLTPAICWKNSVRRLSLDDGPSSVAGAASPRHVASASITSSIVL